MKPKRKHLTFREAGEDSFSVNIYKQKPLQEAKYNWNRSLKGSNGFEANTTINTNSPITEEQYMKRQELKMNDFFFFPIPYQIKMLQAQIQRLFLNWIFSSALNLTSWDSVSTNLFNLLKCRICFLMGNLHFTLTWNRLSFPLKEIWSFGAI